MLREVIGRRSRRLALLAVALLTSMGTLVPGNAWAQRGFDSAEAAMKAMIAEIEADDQQAIVEILGAEYKDRLVTSDWDAERSVREKIAVAAKEKLEAKSIADDRVEWILGSEDWPFPFQTVRGDTGSWAFDTEQGIEAILDRRIGRNELSAIALVHAYVDAQIEYAKEDRDGNGVLEYAQRLASTEGKRDGLYWESAPDEAESPFGPLVKGAEAYLDTVDKGDPIRGYYFRVLTGRRPQLRDQRQHDRGLRTGRLSGGLRQHRRDDLHREQPWRDPTKVDRGLRGNRRLRPRRQLAGNRGRGKALGARKRGCFP